MAKVLGAGLQAVGMFLGWTPLGVALYAAGVAISVADQADKTRKARNRARDQANANLKDRLEMADIQPDAPRTLPLGRVRTVEGVRRRWVSGTNSEKLTMVISFAGCEIDAFEQFYFNDTPVSLDGDGWVTTAPYLKGNLTSQRQTFIAASSTQTVSLAHAPLAGSVTAGWDAYTTGGWDSPDYVAGGTATVSGISGADVTLTGLLVGQTCYVAYQTNAGASTARIRTWTGAAGQNVGAAIAADYPGKITSADKFAGMAVAVVDVMYDPDVYPQGRPNVTAVLRGAKVYDPRKDGSTIGTGSHRIDNPATWEWSENPALCALRYATWSGGFALPAAELGMADIAAAATACDVSTDFVTRIGAGPTSTVTLPRYRCGIVISSAGDPRSGMAGILETMAGRSGWAGGVWRLRAGTKAAPTFTMTPEWLARPLGGDGQPADEPVVTMSNGVTREQKINRISGSCVDPDQRWQALPFPAVQDPALIAAEGEYAVEVEFEGVTHIAHAQHLASIAIRENQAALRISARCNMHAYRCELFDVGTLLLPRYGMTAELAKTAEVVGWRWHPTEGVSLQLAEIADAIYTPVAELVGRDPAPNSTLPALTDVETLTITTISSNTSTLSDGSITTRTQVQWNPAVSEAVRSSGQIEVQYIELSQGALPADWPSWIEGGSSTSATIPALRAGRFYLFRVRALKPSVGVRGPWSLQRGHLVSNTPPLSWGQVSGRPAVGGGNAISNPTFLGRSTAGWNGSNKQVITSSVFSAALTTYGWDPDYSLNGVETGFMFSGGAAPAGGSAAYHDASPCANPWAAGGGLSVLAGRYYQFSVLVKLFRCGVQLYGRNANGSGTLIGYEGFTGDDFTALPANETRTDTWRLDGSDLYYPSPLYGEREECYVRLWYTFRAPTGTTHHAPFVRMTPRPGYNDAVVFMARAMFCEVADLTEGLVPFDMGPGIWSGKQGATTVDIVDDAVNYTAVYSDAAGFTRSNAS